MRDLLHDSGLRSALAAHGLADDPQLATPAPIGWRNLLAIVGSSSWLRSTGSRVMQHRLLRVQPAFLLLERCGHLLSRAALGSGHARPHDITFYEPDAFDRQSHRDIEPPDWAKVVVYPATECGARAAFMAEAVAADVVVKASGVGVFDDALMEGVMASGPPGCGSHLLGCRCAGNARRDHRRATASDPPRAAAAGRGADLWRRTQPVIEAYHALGARACLPIYNGLDPATHHPVPHGSRAIRHRSGVPRQPPARSRSAGRAFLPVAGAAFARPRVSARGFRLGGQSRSAANVRLLGHVGTAQHNALNCSGSGRAEHRARQHGGDRLASHPRRASSRRPARAPAW